MTTVVMIFVLVCGVVAQAVLPAVALLGLAKPPVLLGIVLYYAFTHDRAAVLSAAILGGVLHDAQGSIPLGYSSACFCLAGLIVYRFRDVVFVLRSVTHMVIGGFSAAAITAILAVLFTVQGLVVFLPGGFLAKIAGAGLLGVVTVPLVFRFVEYLDLKLGNLEEAYP
jgi:rod shape-determining protein MreD